MRRILALVFTCGFLAMVQTVSYAGSIPDAVMKPYKASMTALQNKDMDGARKQAKEAWQQAESLLGDSKTTGDLAYNYGRFAMGAKPLKNAVKPLERSADLAELAETNGALIRLEREVDLATILLAINKRDKAHSRINKALKLAETAGIDDTVFAGEIMVHKARLIAGRANMRAKNSSQPSPTHNVYKAKKRPANRTQWRSAVYAQAALDIFDKHPDTARKEYRSIAHKLIGFSHERDKEWLQATLAYQKSMEINKGYLKREDPASITTIGRWTNTRMHLLADMDEDEAYEKGLCDDCWPFDGESAKVKYITKPVKRFPPRMPGRATTSGFSFMKFDLDDGGKPINIEIIHSWPKNMYDKSSIAAVKKWRYTPRVAEETDEQRQNIRTTIRYILTDYYGRDPI